MKISYLVYDAVPTIAELGRIMERVAELGYQGIELTATHPPAYSADEVLALSRQHQLPVVSLLSGWSYANEGLCLAGPEAAVRARAVERLGDYAQLAASLGAVVVVGLMQGLLRDEPNEALANDRIADCLRQAAQRAEEAGTTLVLEPVNHLQVGFNHTAAAAVAMVERVGSPALGYMLDTIHMNIEEQSLVETIRAHGPHIRHFHLCESNGGPFGSGNIDFSRVLTALVKSGYTHYVSVKVYRDLGWDQAAASAAEFLRGCGVWLPYV